MEIKIHGTKTSLDNLKHLGNKTYKWCPNKCGKSVYYLASGLQIGRKPIRRCWICHRCKAIFTDKDLKNQVNG